MPGFFKTGPGQYAQGDIFLGVTVPAQRTIARKFPDLSESEVANLLDSPVHEERLTALLILVARAKSKDQDILDQVAQFYLARLDQVNNWDLVDLSAHSILGPFYDGRDPAPLIALCDSPNLWHRRIAMVATYHFIRHQQYDLPLEIARRLVRDPEDLIQKAVGWMLREIGKRDVNVEVAFLSTHYRSMPRTMLRYAIEKFDPATRKRYLLGEIH